MTWEKNNQFDVGTNLGFLDGRINATADYYIRNTNGALLNQNLSRTTGFTGYINNVGSMQNEGIELTLNLVPIRVKDFQWEVNASYTHNQNRVTSLPTGDQLNGSYMLRVGQPFYSFYTRGWAGVDPANGNALYYLDSTRTTTTTNKTAAQLFIVGKQADPKYFGTLGNTLTYKGFSLNFDFYYNFGNYIQEAYAQYFLDGTYSTRGKYQINLQRWQKPGDITNVPKYVASSSVVSASGSDRLLSKGDYIRLRNVQLSYRYNDKKVLDKFHINGVNIYARGTNLWTKTYDPNLLSDPEQGITGVNNQQVFASKSVTFGLNVTF